MLIRAALLVLVLPIPAFAQQNCAHATTQTDMTQCAGSDFQAADADLNAAFVEAMTRMKSLDADVPADQKGAEAALRRAQRAWITVRDSTCEAKGRVYFGGSMQPMVIAGCKTEMTRARTTELRSLAAEGVL